MVSLKLKYAISLLIIFAFLVSACSPQVKTQQPVCNKPYILVGNDCCLDKDDNSICDKDEVALQKAKTFSIIDKQELAEKTALSFARVWEHKQWDVMYTMFTNSLRKQKTKEEFEKVMGFEETESNVVVRLDKVDVENESTSYAYYSISSALFDTKAPSMKLQWEDNDWKVDSFATYFLTTALPLAECKDLNQCTIDIYSFNDKSCKNVEFFPCCGNNLCESSESSWSCDLDCFSAKFTFKKRGENKIISFFGFDYNMTINDIQEKREYNANFGKAADTKIINITINAPNIIDITITDILFFSYIHLITVCLIASFFKNLSIL